MYRASPSLKKFYLTSFSFTLIERNLFRLSSVDDFWQFSIQTTECFFIFNVYLFFEVIGDCRDGWTKFQGSCYLFASDQANWPEAQVIIMFDLSTPYLYKNTGFDKKKEEFCLIL